MALKGPHTDLILDRAPIHAALTACKIGIAMRQLAATVERNLRNAIWMAPCHWEVHPSGRAGSTGVKPTLGFPRSPRGSAWPPRGPPAPPAAPRLPRPPWPRSASRAAGFAGASCPARSRSSTRGAYSWARFSTSISRATVWVSAALSAANTRRIVSSASPISITSRLGLAWLATVISPPVCVRWRPSHAAPAHTSSLGNDPAWPTPITPSATASSQG